MRSVRNYPITLAHNDCVKSISVSPAQGSIAYGSAITTYSGGFSGEQAKITDRTTGQVYTLTAEAADATAQYYYSIPLIGCWQNNTDNIVTDATTITAYGAKTLRSYTIKFVNYDGTTLQTKTVNYGEVPSYTGSTPTKPSTAQYNYTFNG